VAANVRSWRILPASPTAAFTPFPRIDRTYLKRALRVRLDPFAEPPVNDRYLRNPAVHRSGKRPVAKVGQEFDAPYSLTETGRATLAEMTPRHAA
jgi:hypothetical protein